MNHRSVALLGLLSLAVGQASEATPPATPHETVSHLLDGRTFYGREKVGKEERNEIYVFKDGTFEASWWAVSAFHAGPYTARTEGDAILFNAETSSDSAHTARWEGRVVGDHLEVKGVFRMPNEESFEVAGMASMGERGRASLVAPEAIEMLKKVPSPGTPEYARLKQQLTVGDIGRLGAALLSWLRDQVGQPGFAGKEPKKVVSLQDYAPVTAEQVRQMLVPKYWPKVEGTDSWGHPIEMRLNLGALRGNHVVCLRSPGRDGRFSGDSYTVESFPPDSPDQDIVWCDGAFVRWPDTPTGTPQ